MTKKKSRKSKTKTKSTKFFGGDSVPSNLPRNSKIMILEYYQKAFALFHNEYCNRPDYFRGPHPIRNRYWQFMREGTYDLYQARQLLGQYLSVLEREMSEIIQKHSLAYWLHIYRRLFPGTAGRDEQPGTIMLTRAVLEAAIQKYAKFALCDGIALSKDVRMEDILCGLLMAPEFEMERELIMEGPNQLVLTNFSTDEFIEFYQVEKLAYEVWRAAAMLRSIGKGAKFVIENSSTRFDDERSEELNFLVVSHDERLSGAFSVSASGTVFESIGEDTTGCIFIPVYNAGAINIDRLREGIGEFCGMTFAEGFVPNFIWLPHNLRNFRRVHLPLADSFRKKHGVNFDAVLSVIVGMCDYVFYRWIASKGLRMIHFWQRGYEGPERRRTISEVIRNNIPAVARILDIPVEKLQSIDFDAAIDFWTLDTASQSKIDLSYSGPHSIFLPAGGNHIFVDYAWMVRRLYDLFYGVKIDDQNFKGEALECVMREGPSVLPSGPCLSLPGEKRQIDYAYAKGEFLIIAECKAVARSIGYDRGHPLAISYRREQVIERSLHEIDGKAQWLAQNPIGRNYDITKFKYILPVGISPFVEFIPSLSSRFWISEKIPRVLTPSEFEELCNDSEIIFITDNIVSISCQSQ